MRDVTHLLRDNPVLLLFVVAGLGVLVGRVKVFGVSLGVAAVLFVGLAFSAIDPTLRLPELVQTLGLVLFVYTVGLASGPGFFASLAGRGLKTNIVAVTIVGFGAVGSMIAGRALHLSTAQSAGLFAGGTTNTPALAAVIEAISGRVPADVPVVAYSVAYPMGVLGALLAIVLFDRLASRDVKQRKSVAPSSSSALENVTVRVLLPEPVPVAWMRTHHHVVFTRLQRGDVVDVATDAAVLKNGDVVTMVGPHAEIEKAVGTLGEKTERIDLNRHEVDYRRVFVSDPKVTRRPLSSLQLGDRFDAVVTRVRRGDVELFPEDDLELELGDRVRVVAPRARLDEVSKFFGDSYRALSEIDVITFGIGIALGLVLGSIPIPFKLGLAGGPLIAGLVLGRVGRTGPLVWTTSYNANLTVRQLGVVLFLAGIGTRAGNSFAAAIRGGMAIPLFCAGALVTLFIAAAVLVIGRLFLKLPRGVLYGVLAGVQTQPAVLAFATEREKSEQPNVGYATVYPLVTIAKILLVQAIVLFR